MVKVRELTGYLVAIGVILFLINLAWGYFVTMRDDLRLALTMIMFVWILNWMSKMLGSPRLALIFALVMSYIVFFKHPEAIFGVFGMLFLLSFIKPFWEKIAPSKKKSPEEELREWLKEMKPIVVISPTGGYYPVVVQQGGNEKKEG